jgi:hypothetical protein
MAALQNEGSGRSAFTIASSPSVRAAGSGCRMIVWARAGRPTRSLPDGELIGPPRHSAYRASGLVPWHFSDLAITSRDVRSSRDERT